jgi:Ca2+-binding RTX toxin-like protein
MSDDPDDCEPAYSPDGSTVVSSHFGPNSNCNPNTTPSELGFLETLGGARASMRVAVQPSGVSGFRPNWQPAASPAGPSGGGSGIAGTTLGTAASVRGKCFHKALTIRGTSASEKIVGTPGDDVIHGFKGNDRIIGRGGEDILCGGRGEDRIFGKGQNDILVGGDGSDYLKGGPGVNRIFGGTPKAPDEKANNVCVTGPSDTEQNCQQVR